MDRPLPPPSRTGSKARETHQRRPSLLASTGSACHICKKGAADKCATCAEKTCIGCLQGNNICRSCITLTQTRDAAKPVSLYASIFPSKKKQSNDTATPVRRGSLEVSSSVRSLWAKFRRSSAARNLMEALEKENANSPQNRQMNDAVAAALAAPGSEELASKLEREVRKYKELAEKLEIENDELRQRMDAENAPENGEQNSAAGVSAADLAEIKARIVELQVQVQEARGEVIRVKSELEAAHEKERQLEQYIQDVLMQQQQGAGQATAPTEVGPNGRRRSPIPPCVPFPETLESLAWLQSIQDGTYKDYWLTAPASAPVCIATGTDSLPTPPGLAVSSNGKRRSEIPRPPPLPADIAAQCPLLPNVNPAHGGGRLPSAPAVIMVVPFQVKRQPLFKPQGGPKVDLKPLYWTTLDQNRAQGTIFETIVSGEPPVKPDVMSEKIKVLMVRFVRRAPKVQVDPSKGASQAAQEKIQVPRLQIMDPKRDQQIAIALKSQFRNVKLSEINRAIVSLDPHMLSPERVKTLLEIIPTPEEITQLEGFSAGNQLDAAFFDGASDVERFFLEMSNFPRLRQRLMCFLLLLNWEASRDQLLEDLDTYEDAIRTIRESKEWKSFLAVLLETGNCLNDGNNTLSGAWGFSLKEGLKKFVELKSCENNSRFSLMHWVADVAASHKPELFTLQSQFGSVSDASARSIEELKAEVASVKRQVEIVRTEVEKYKSESADSASKFLSRMVPFLEKVLSVEYEKIQKKMDDIEKAATQLVKMHGENPTQTTCQQFFLAILDGVSAFLKCHAENMEAKALEQKQQQKGEKVEDARKATPAKRDQNNRIMRDTGVASGEGRLELEREMAKRRRDHAKA